MKAFLLLVLVVVAIFCIPLIGAGVLCFLPVMLAVNYLEAPAKRLLLGPPDTAAELARLKAYRNQYAISLPVPVEFAGNAVPWAIEVPLIKGKTIVCFRSDPTRAYAVVSILGDGIKAAMGCCQELIPYRELAKDAMYSNDDGRTWHLCGK